MPADESTVDHPSRRAFMRGVAGAGLAGGSAAVLTGCGSGAGSGRKLLAAAAPAARRADIAVLNDLLALERTAVVAYTAGVQLLSGHARGAAAVFLGHELSHARKLESVIKGAGGKLSPPPPSVDQGTPDSQAEVLDTLRAAEAALVRGYLGALPQLTPGWLRSVAAGIFANEAEHVSVLRLIQGRPPVPHAFVSASE